YRGNPTSRDHESRIRPVFIMVNRPSTCWLRSQSTAGKSGLLVAGQRLDECLVVAFDRLGQAAYHTGDERDHEGAGILAALSRIGHDVAEWRAVHSPFVVDHAQPFEDDAPDVFLAESDATMLAVSRSLRHRHTSFLVQIEHGSCQSTVLTAVTPPTTRARSEPSRMVPPTPSSLPEYDRGGFLSARPPSGRQAVADQRSAVARSNGPLVHSLHRREKRG